MSSRRIHIKGGYVHEEDIAAEAGIYPGMLLALNSDGEVASHDEIGGVAERAFADEDALQGDTVDDVYAIDEIVSYLLALPGTVVNAMIQAGQDLSPGDILISGGDGTLISVASEASGYSSGDYHPIAIARDACDLTASGAVAAISPVRVL